MSDYQQDQASWEWALEDELRCQAEQDTTCQPTDKQVNDRLLADFDSIFMVSGENE